MFVHPITINYLSNFGKTEFFKCSSNSNNYLQKSISFTGQDFFDYDRVLKKKLDERSKWNKFWGRGKKQAKEDTKLELVGFTKAQNIIAQEKDKQLDIQEKLLIQKDETLKKEKEKTQLLEKQIKMEQEANAKDKVIVELQAKLDAARKKTAAAQLDFDSQSEKVDRIKKEQQILTKREKGKGWDKIAGHEDLKRKLEEGFINKLALEKSGLNVNIPNGILFYGQPGTGKTRFAQAFAEQAGCEFVKIDTMQEDADVIDDLSRALRKARHTYNSPENPKKRTVILLDDFDSIARLNKEEERLMQNNSYDFSDTCVGQLAEFLSNCADKYKATIFMTTNYPRKIDSKLLNGDLTSYQVFLGPPNPLDAAKIFKYHLNGFTDEEIDYQKLGNEVCKAIQNDEAYSAQGIVNVVDYAKEKCKGTSITEADLLEAVKNVEPDIPKKELDAFLDDMIALRSEFEVQEEKV